MPKMKLKDVTCLDITCNQCPFYGIPHKCGQVTDVYTTFGEQAPENHVFDDVDLEKEVEVDG